MKARNILQTAAALLLLVSPLAAQQPRRGSTIGTDFYWLHQREQNQQVSPLRYAGGGSGFGLSYETGTMDWSTGMRVLFTSAQLHSGITRNQDHVGETMRLVLNLPYQRRVTRAASRFAGVRLGAELSGDLIYRKHSYSTMLSTEHFVDAFVGLAATAGWQGPLGDRWRLDYRAALPVVGLVWRTPYTGAKYIPDAQLTLPDELFGLDNRIVLARRLSNALDFRASYQFQLLRHQSTWNLAVASHRAGIGLGWHIRRASPLSETRTTGGAQ